MKLDVEGFETVLLPRIGDVRSIDRVTLVVELHPLGLNGIGDPAACLEALRRSGATVRTISGEPVREVDPAAFTNVVCTWRDA